MPSTTTVVKLLDLSPVPITICITRRDSFTFGFLFEDENGEMDFTDDAFLLTVNPQEDGGGADVFAIANSNVLDDTGLVQFLPSVANLTAAAGDYFYDIQWTESGGDVRTVVSGTFTIGDDISD